MSDEFDDDPFGDWDKNITLRRAQFQGREFVREADGGWRDEWGYELKSENGKLMIVKPMTPPFTTHSLARWANQIIPEQQWFMNDWIPIGQVVGLYGRPGSRKSTLLLQWMIGAVLGKGFGNAVGKLAQGPTYGLFCEDTEAEIARRALAILNGYGAKFEQMENCHPESLVGAKLTHFFSFRRSGVMVPTPAWEKFNEDLDRFNPVLVTLDVAANFFSGNEINRTETTAFLRLLDKIANERQFALIFSYHPSLRGLREGSLSSGNTAWEGGVRARMTIEDPTDDDAEDDQKHLPNQSDRRVLTLVKANYAKSGATFNLVVRNGFFVPEDLDPITQASLKRSPADKAAAERVFLDRLKDAIDLGRYVSPSKNTPMYAPLALSGDGFNARALEAAMNRCFDKRKLRLDPKIRGVGRWIICDPNTESDA